MNKHLVIALPMLFLVVLTGVLLLVSGCKSDHFVGNTGSSDMFPAGTSAANAGVSSASSASSSATNTTTYSSKSTTTTPPPTPPANANKQETPLVVTNKAVINTDKGTIVCELYGKDAPKTVDNFVKLARKKYYDGLKFHRVEPGFVIQGGDPKGDGTGGQAADGPTIKLEISPRLRHWEGALAMARSGDPDSAGSQFYITLAPQPSLDDQYAVFGKVISGMDVAKKIVKGDKMLSITIQ